MLKSITRAFISLITFHSLCLICGAHISERPSCNFKPAEKELAGKLFHIFKSNSQPKHTEIAGEKRNADGWGIPSVKEMVQSQS